MPKFLLHSIVNDESKKIKTKYQIIFKKISFLTFMWNIVFKHTIFCTLSNEITHTIYLYIDLTSAVWVIFCLKYDLVHNYLYKWCICKFDKFTYTITFELNYFINSWNVKFVLVLDAFVRNFYPFIYYKNFCSYKNYKTRRWVVWKNDEKSRNFKNF